MLTGTLDDFTLADVFRLLSLARRTGKLEVERSAGKGRVFFRDGEIYYADSSMTREPLGKKLIRAHVVTETQLMQALDQAAAGQGRVGDILVTSGVATTEQLQTAVKQQIEDAVFEMLRWDRGDFSWEPAVEANVEVPISVSVENLIMEASRRMEELELINRKVPRSDIVVGMAPTPPEGAVEINITPEEWRILVLIDGRRTVRDISDGSGWDEFTTMRTLYGLVSAGLVEVLGPLAEPSVEPAETVPGFETLTPEPAPWEVPAAEAEAPDVEEHSVEPPVEEPAAEVTTISLPDTEPEEPAAAAEPAVEAVPAISEFPSFEEPAAEPEPAVEPAGEPFLSDLLRSDPDPEPEPAYAAPPPVPEPEPQPESLPEPVSATGVPGSPAELQLEIDRAEMARELSGLFRDDRPAFRPLIPGEEGEGESEGGAPPHPPQAPPVRKRVEDDEQVTKGLISRLIDGVKGL